MHTSETALLPRALAALLLSLLPWVADSADLMVLGTPHLADLQPVALPAQEQRVVEALAQFRPTQVCIEAIPGERTEEFVRDPVRYGELLAMFAMDAVRLAPEQQARRALDARAARQRAADLAAANAPTPAEQALLISLQLAAFDPWSALLNWSRLDDAGKAAARPALGSPASDRLAQLAQSQNEMARIAIPLARQLGHRQLCAVDPFADEIDVAALADELQPMLADPAIGESFQRFEAWTRQGWPSENDDALLHLLGRYNGAEYANRDRAAQWDIFLKGAGDHPAGERRLMLWHARNTAIQHELLRAMAGSNGDRTVLLIGAAHRPFLEASLRALPWVTVVDPLSVIGGPARRAIPRATAAPAATILQRRAHRVSLPPGYRAGMIDLGTIAGLHRHQHQLAAYCPRCDRWTVLPLEDLIGRGHGGRRLPFPVRCRTCGEAGRLQVRPPVPTRVGTVGWT